MSWHDDVAVTAIEMLESGALPKDDDGEEYPVCLGKDRHQWIRFRDAVDEYIADKWPTEVST